jgi:hypothetical protein
VRVNGRPFSDRRPISQIGNGDLADRIRAEVQDADFTIVQESLDSDQARITQHDLARLDSEAE